MKDQPKDDKPKDDEPKTAVLYALVATSIFVLAVYSATSGWM
jgi:hypothetical protein